MCRRTKIMIVILGFSLSAHVLPLEAAPEDRCYEFVQGNIPWNYQGTSRWKPDNVKRLCRGTSRPKEPGPVLIERCTAVLTGVRGLSGSGGMR